MSKHETYRLSRILTVTEILAADCVSGIHPKHLSHVHSDAWELIFCLSGDAEVLKGPQSIRLRANEIMLIQPGISHSFITKRHDASLFSVSFACSSEALRDIQGRVFLSTKVLSLMLRELISELQAGFIQNTDPMHLVRFIPNRAAAFAAEQMVATYLEQILIGLYRLASVVPGPVVRTFPTKESMQTYLSEMVTFYISENLSKHLSLDEIAAHFHYSRSRIGSIYKNTTGNTINKAISLERIRRAQSLLLKQDKSVAQIAEEVGFASPQYFSRRFTKEVGCSPSRYCQMLKEQEASLQTEKRIYELHLRDPYILPVGGTYYLYGTRADTYLGKADGFDVYTSKDLILWSGPFPVFTRPDDFWADRHFWAPEVHLYRGQYYMLASFKSPDRCRGTQILRADSPMGPFFPWSDGPVTPPDWECLHGTLYLEDDTPYMVFNHEWLQVQDGEICAVALAPDLRTTVGEPTVLFRASEPSWSSKSAKMHLADGPFLYRTRKGTLLLLWCNNSQNAYCVAVSRSLSGKLEGPWLHNQDPLIDSNGGHGMVFRSFQDELMFVFHRPNRSPHERPHITEICETDTGLAIK